MSIEAMKQARNLLLAYQNMGDFRIANDCLSTVHALTKAIEKAEQWDTSDMAHRSGGLSVEQEPVGEIIESSFFDKTNSLTYFYKAQPPVGTKLYTAPQKYCPSENNAAYEKGFVEGMAKQTNSSVDRAVNAMTKPWVGLITDEIFKEAWKGRNHSDFARGAQWAEAKLKERNNG